MRAFGDDPNAEDSCSYEEHVITPQARLRRWSMGGAIGPKLCLAQRSKVRKEKPP